MRSAHWTHVITDAGHHLRLVGANGEIVMTSEPYADPRSVVEAMWLAKNTVSFIAKVRDA